MRERQIILQNVDKANIALASTLDSGITHLLQVFILHFSLCEHMARRHLEMSRHEANHLALDIFKTWIKSQEIPNLLILVQEVAKVGFII